MTPTNDRNHQLTLLGSQIQSKAMTAMPMTLASYSQSPDMTYQLDKLQAQQMGQSGRQIMPTHGHGVPMIAQQPSPIMTPQYQPIR
jgi:hypothetical protein